jgi:phosphoribosylaminoimidazolecarboxamide formyltransferase/IMP cyclohydrolase
MSSTGTSHLQETKPRRALLSVSDKQGLAAFARRLAACGFELISTGGTARTLREAGLTVKEVAEITEYPEMLEGRVKTLHPRVHGGLLGRWPLADHRRQMQTHGIVPITVLVVNLYPFEQVAARAQTAGVERQELIENIDIGGPAMLRSGAKNYESVAVITDPADYDGVAGELESAGEVSRATRWRLAQKAFQRTAGYDAAIAGVLGALAAGEPEERIQLGDEELPSRLRLSAERRQVLRYGENPHQRAAVYTDGGTTGGVAQARILQGKELSYNNLVDLDAAWELVNELEQPGVAIIKHTNPAGCAMSSAGLHVAYEQALECDPVSAYGGVIGLNREVDGETAEAIARLFVECIAAPRFSPEARERLAAKKNLRLVEVDASRPRPRLRSISGGWLLQSEDERLWSEEGWRVVTRRQPDAVQERGLRFGWAVAKHVKSNAIVFARATDGGGQTLAVGAGQMSRVDAVRLAAMKAQLPLAGAAVASDAFFPFPDGIEAAVERGASCLVQPGGSVHDADCIAACDRLGVAMVFTGMRHFRH